MIQALHLLTISTYVVLPLLAAVVLLRPAEPSVRQRRLAGFILTAVAGLALGGTLAVMYAIGVGGQPRIAQVLLTGYFGVSLLLILRFYDSMLRWLAKLPVAWLQPGLLHKSLAGLMTTGRLVLLFGLGLPYLLSTVLIYRPKTAHFNNPNTMLNTSYEAANFVSTDGIRLAGWWIPSDPPPHNVQKIDPDWGKRTVLICPGLTDTKSTQVLMASQFVPYGYNVLIFDFRAHGDSAGQLISFGDKERQDVLGAVRWVRQHHPEGSAQIFGVGLNTGAAALIGAAADPSPEGQALDAIAVDGIFRDFDRWSDSAAGRFFPPPLSWLLQMFGVPIASAQTGVDLVHFSPGKLNEAIWPRPVMIIQTARDPVVSYEQGRRFFDLAPQPKQGLFLDRYDEDRISHNPRVGMEIRQFFQTARPMPVI
jgi:fermentation-respiration switch protein FrsA (DUF1100 family)